MSIFNIQSIAKHYQKGNQTISVFNDLKLTIEVGDFIAIMGPSGSGKTTLLNILGGIDRPDTGTITFEGEPIQSLSESALSKWRSNNVGFIFQFYNLMPMLSAAKNVELPLLLTKIKRRERLNRVISALTLVGLEDRAKHSPQEMSGGQQQRVAIARAIVADPKILLCDEPTGDLDRDTANDILDILKLLNSKYNKTIVMVTHDPVAASSAAKVLQLDKGEFTEAAIT